MSIANIKYLSLVIVVLVTILGFGLRVYMLTSSPAGLYIDETSIGYNAYSLLKTGKDEHGVSWPLFFEAFGEWKLPVYIYAVYIAQLILGPTDVSVRLPAVIFGSLTIPLIYLWIREMFVKTKKVNNEVVALFAAFLLAISPWHFQFSHAGFEASLAVFFIVLALALFFKAKNQNSTWELLLSLLAFVQALYSYNSSRVVVPVMIMILIILFWRQFRFSVWFGSLCMILLLALPLIKFSLSQPGMARIQQVGIFYQNHISNPWQELVKNYLINISPRYLFVSGDPTIAHLSPHRMSLHYLVEIPFFILGLFYLLKLKSRETLFVLAFLLIGFLPPALTTLNPHALRAMLVVPVTVLVSAMGMAMTLIVIKPQLFKNLFWVSISVTLILSLVRFLNIYHNLYTRDTGWDWQVDIRRASEKVLSLENNYSQVLFEQSGANRISYLWYLKVDPQIFQISNNKDQLGKYQFNVIDITKIAHDGSRLYITKKRLAEPLVEVIYYSNSETAFYIYKI